MYRLVYRDFAARYKQSALGFAWAVIQPLAMVLTLTLVFSKFAGMASPGAPYTLLVLSGLLPWQFFSSGVLRGSTSMVQSSNLVTKVYFPRILIPISSVLIGCIDFAITFLLFLVLEAAYGRPFTTHLLLAPVIVLLLLLATLSVSLWLSAVHVRYRDVGPMVTLALQILMYASPIAYSSSAVPADKFGLYQLNPIVSLVEVFRWSTLGSGFFTQSGLLYSLVTVTIGLFFSLWYFQRCEGGFSDEI